MAVPKKRTSIPKKHNRKNIWKRKGYWAALKTFSLAKSLSTGNQKSFFCTTRDKKKIKRWTNLTRLDTRKGLILFIV